MYWTSAKPPFPGTPVGTIIILTMPLHQHCYISLSLTAVHDLEYDDKRLKLVIPTSNGGHDSQTKGLETTSESTKTTNTV